MHRAIFTREKFELLSILPQLVIVILTIIISTSYSQQKFPQEAEPGRTITEDLDLDNMEFSGIVWQRDLQHFFIVSDGGILVSATPDFEIISEWEIDADLEGVTVVPDRPEYVYLANEDPDSILEFHLKTERITRRFDLTSWMDGPSNAGLEALTFVPDENTPETGFFYAGLQDNGEIYIFELPIITSSSSTSVNHVGTIESITDDISALNYCHSQQQIYVIYENENLLASILPDGTATGTWELPGSDQEGITVKGTELYITEDYGRSEGNIILYQPVILHPQPDMNCDGFVNLSDITIMSSNWLTNTEEFGNIDMADLGILSTNWLK